MLSPARTVVAITRIMGIVLIALSLNEIIRRKPWYEGYTGITAFLISGSIMLIVIGVYLLIRGNNAAKPALKNVNKGFDEFSFATLVVIIVKTIGILIMVWMAAALLDILNYIVCIYDATNIFQLYRTPVGLTGIKALLYSSCLFLIGYYLYFKGKAFYRIIHIDIREKYLEPD